ncbi:hypothetical protein [Shewanella frigidimarina]|uniref:hypothetical protein n=1 Tax=Shewanella frigidimarina TaxID=56812 RepID=UPI003FA0D115
MSRYIPESLRIFNRTHNRPTAAAKRERSADAKARYDRLRKIEDMKLAKEMGVSLAELGAI